MRSPAPLFITAFWSLCLAAGTFLVLAGNPPWGVYPALLAVAVLQAALVAGGPKP